MTQASQRKRTRRTGASFLTVLFVLLIVGGGIAYGVWNWLPSKGNQGPVIVTHVVERKPFTYDVVERGEIESSSNVEVRCEVKAQKTGGHGHLGSGRRRYCGEERRHTGEA